MLWPGRRTPSLNTITSESDVYHWNRWAGEVYASSQLFHKVSEGASV